MSIIEHLGHKFIRCPWNSYTSTTDENGWIIYVDKYICNVCNAECFINKSATYAFYTSKNYAFKPLVLNCNEMQIKKLLE